MTTLEKLQAAREALARKTSTVDARNRAAEEDARRIADEEARVDAEKRAVAQAETDAIEADRAAVAALEKQIEAERLAAVRAEAEAAEAVSTLWARVDADAERLAAAPYGPANIQLRAELALRRSIGVVVPADLWQVSGSLADVTFAGVTWRVQKKVSDVAPGAGFMDIVTVSTPGGWRGVLNVADLAAIGRENPQLRNPDLTRKDA